MPNTILELTGEYKNRYLASLISSLRLAETIVEKLDINGHGQVQEVLGLLQFLQGDEKFSPYETIKIESSCSGFPHFSQVNELLLDQKYARDFLEKMPSLEQCVERCRGLLYSGSASSGSSGPGSASLVAASRDSNEFARLQEQVRKIRFYSALQSQRLPSLAECFLESAERMEKFQAYTVVYKGYDTAKMRFLSYSLLLFQRRNSPYLQAGGPGGGQSGGPAAVLTPLLQERIARDVGLSTAEMFYNLNQQPHFAVVSVERLVLGPFYTKDAYQDQNQVQEQNGQVQVQDKYHEPVFAALAALRDRQTRASQNLLSVLELEQQLSEDEDTFLTQEIRGALQQQHKQAYRPPVKYKRHFLCSDQQLLEELPRHLSSERYVARVYCAQPETGKQETEKKKGDEMEKGIEEKGTGEKTIEEKGIQGKPAALEATTEQVTA